MVFTTGKSMTVNSGVPINLISVRFTVDVPSAISSTLKSDGEDVDYCLTVLSFSGVCILFA